MKIAYLLGYAIGLHATCAIADVTPLTPLSCFGERVNSISLKSQFPQTRDQVGGTCYAEALAGIMSSYSARNGNPIEVSADIVKFQLLNTQRKIKSVTEFSKFQLGNSSVLDGGSSDIDSLALLKASGVVSKDAYLSQLSEKLHKVWEEQAKNSEGARDALSATVQANIKARTEWREANQQKLDQLRFLIGQIDTLRPKLNKVSRRFGASLSTHIDQGVRTVRAKIVEDKNKLRNEIDAIWAESDKLELQAKAFTQSRFITQCTLASCVKLATAMTSDDEVLQDAEIDSPLAESPTIEPTREESKKACDPIKSQEIYERIKESLCLGIPMATGVWFDSAFQVKSDDRDLHQVSGGGGHAIDLIGIEETASGPKYVFRNSWGKNSYAYLDVRDGCKIYSTARYLTPDEAKIIKGTDEEKKAWMAKVQERWSRPRNRVGVALAI